GSRARFEPASFGRQMTESLQDLSAALAGRYRVDREIGAGGMATVYQAHDLKHDRSVALKVLRPNLAASLGQERFLREVGIASGLTHPNIVSLLDSGTVAGTLYYTMPFLDGGSLRTHLERRRELPVAEANRIAADILEALRHAHAAGIVHRDVKPENILFSGGRALVADFGIAKAIAQAGTARLTATGVAIGTPAYMPPEQAAADPAVDHRADLYALGVVWYEMLAGVPVFSGRSPQQLIAAHLARAPEPLHDVRPAVPRALSDLILRCLEKRPADRWQSADEIAHVLGTLESGGTVSGGRLDPVPTLQSFRVDEALCQRLSVEGFDPRMVGDEMRYLDNGRISDTVVCYLGRWCIDPGDGEQVLREVPYRAVAPALFGFDAGRRYRPNLPIDDHLVLLGGLLRHVLESSGARHLVVAGFSSGGDLAIRLAAADPARVELPIGGVLLLGPNLAIENAFASGQLAGIESDSEAELLPFVHKVSAAATTLQEWLDINEYLVRLMGRFRADIPVLRDFARGIAGPFVAARLTPFVSWYREATRLGRLVRGVFEDTPSYRALVRDLQVGHRETGLLGERHQPGSLIIEPASGHFDLEGAALVARHLDPLVRSLREAPSRPAVSG
ncbi:MAG: serine/threonine-protein kinase, partial [Gemmatimonadales bacterium]|nr:serine/threonine-protein kinase [Gemmatimonadales bacterium]